MSFEGYFGYEPGRANYLTHVSERHHAVFVEVPKTGCTTVKRVMQFSEVKGDTSKIGRDVHKRSTSPLVDVLASGWNPDEVLGQASTYFRFSFVRNPYTRTLSCYKDKIVNNQWERERRMPLLGFKPTDDVEFIDFLRRVDSQHPREMDIHWAPQSFLLGLDRIKYDFLGRQETFARDLQRVIDYLGMEAPDGAVEQLPWHSTGARESLREFYTPETTALVQRIYAQDFARLGYGLSVELA